MDVSRAVDRVLGAHPEVWVNPPCQELISETLRRRDAMVSTSGELATWMPRESTGRRPQNTYIVDRPEIHAEVDWKSPYCLSMAPDTFGMLLEDALAALARAPRVYLTERALGADPRFALVVRTVTDRALSALFTDNMFRPVPAGAQASAFAGRPFALLALP